jgi:hypothetical protein
MGQPKAFRRRLAFYLGLVLALAPGVARAITLLQVERSTKVSFIDPPFLDRTTTDSDPVGYGHVQAQARRGALVRQSSRQLDSNPVRRPNKVFGQP